MTTVEVDRRWVRITMLKSQTHVDFQSLETLHYSAIRSHGMIVGRLYLADRHKKNISLQSSGFGVDRNFAEFIRAVSATLAAIADVRPDMLVVPEAPASSRLYLGTVVLLAAVVIAGAQVYFDPARNTEKVVIAAVVVLFVFGYVLFVYGPPRKKTEPVPARELAEQLAASLD